MWLVPFGLKCCKECGVIWNVKHNFLNGCLLEVHSRCSKERLNWLLKETTSFVGGHFSAWYNFRW